MKSAGLAGFKRDVTLLPFWIKLVGCFLLFIFPPLGWLAGFALVVLLNWPTEQS